jgi:beta-galactosidase/beta-glucuronidase
MLAVLGIVSPPSPAVALHVDEAIPPLPAGALQANPRPEYPRPDFARDSWLSLNGVWDFDLDPGAVGESGRWYLWGTPRAPHRFGGRIVVPFPWQSLAAFGRGAAATPRVVNGPLAAYQGTVWYARRFAVPPTFPRGDRVVLNFGAAEQSARVWVDAHLAGAHEGGYLPFSLDITNLVARGARDNTLVVEVTQPANLTGDPHGKQGGFWYSRSGGLWQSVWLEATGPAAITALHVVPHALQSRAQVVVTLAGARFGAADLTLALSDPGGHLLVARRLRLAGGTRTASTTLVIRHPLLWDTTHPYLYHLTASLAPRSPDGRPMPADDVVRTYFGLRDVSVGQITAGGQRYPYIFLNGHPQYIMGALDQDFNPQGIYTAPSDAFLRDDILRARRLGLNLLRIHIKVPDPRLLYWADRLGMLIWEEPPDFAEDGASFDSASLDRWLTTLRGMIVRDANHPSTIIWGLLNEEWGTGDLRVDPARARWLAGIYADVTRLDPTRLVVDQSGWSHTRTDIFDVHQYTADWYSWRSFLDTLDTNIYAGSDVTCGCIGGTHDGFVAPYRYTDQPTLMSEYAAGPWTGDWPNKNDARPDGFRDNSAPFRWLTNELRLHPFIAGYIYTESPTSSGSITG